MNGTFKVKELEENLKGMEKELNLLRARDKIATAVLNSISEEVILIDSDYNILEANRAFLDLVGLPKEKVLGQKCYELLSLAGRHCDRTPDTCPLGLALSTKEKIEVRVTQRVLGGIREFLRIAYPVHLEPQGPSLVLEVNRQWEEAGLLVQHLRHAEQRFQAVLNSVSEAIVSVNQEHQIVLFNKAAENIFGYKGCEVLGQDLGVLLPPQYSDHYRFIKRFLKDPKIGSVNRSLRVTALRKGGEEFPVDLSISSLMIDGEYLFTAIIRDITTQVETEKRLVQGERFAAVGRAVAHVVHELKTPLMIIGGLSQQLLRGMGDTASQKKLEIICEEVARLERLLLDLGDFTKEQRLVLRPYDVNDLIADVVGMIKALPSSQNYTFLTELCEGNLILRCDPDKLKQVLINLVVNAMDAMEEGGTVQIHARRHQDRAEIRVIDSGVGIREEDLSHIFEPFYTTRKKGVGLGLSICYKIVQAHSGDLLVESKFGEGTVFTISLPME